MPPPPEGRPPPGRGDTAGVPLPPPLIPVGALALAWLLGRLAPLPPMPRLPLAGDLLALAALGLFVWSLLALRRHRTDVRPDRPTTALVTEGPYALTRNPIYVAMSALAAGLALVWGNPWAWLAAAAVPVLLDRLVIAREEPYLARRFGPAYDAYRARVRRWL